MTQYDPSGGGGQYDSYRQYGQQPPYAGGPGPHGPYSVPYAGQVTPTQRRPTSVLVLAIFGIILGGLGLLSPLALLPYYVQIGPPNPVLQMTRDDPVLWGWTLLSLVAALPLAVALLAGSIGILTLKPWARTTLLVWAVADIVMGLASTVMTFGVMLPKMLALQNASNDPIVRAGVSGGIGGAVIGLPMAFILPVCVLYFLTRPKAKAAFAPPATPGPAAP